MNEQHIKRLFDEAHHSTDPVRLRQIAQTLRTWSQWDKADKVIQMAEALEQAAVNHWADEAWRK